jgi:lysophospholipase L1-like esterase
VEVFLALQPYLPLSKKALTASEQEILEVERLKPAKVEVVTASFGMLEEELARVAAAKGVSFRSFVDVFDDEDVTCFFDMVHPNDYGYRKIADVATEWLAARMPALAQ